MKTLTAPLALSETQVRAFHEEGYLIVEDVFTQADLRPVEAEITEAIDEKAKELLAAGKIRGAHAELDFERRLAALCRETDEIALSIWDGKLCGPAFFNLIRNPRLLDIAETLCGPELIASSVYRLRPKVPGHGHGPVPWHQDSSYLETACDKPLVVTVWIPLVDATKERGCLWVIPRAHKGEVAPHYWGQRYLEIRTEDLPQGTPVCVPVRKGGVLLLTNRTPHASFDNNSDVVRWSMDLRYQSAALPTNAAITRLEGEAPPSEGGPIACYPPEADFLVRSRRRPQEVLTDPAQFHRLRKSHLRRPVTARWEKLPGTRGPIFSKVQAKA